MNEEVRGSMHDALVPGYVRYIHLQFSMRLPYISVSLISIHMDSSNKKTAKLINV